MAEQNLKEAQEALRKRYGRTLRASEEDGKRELASALVKDLAVSNDEAVRLINALMAAHSIRWVEGSGRTISSNNSLAGTQFGAQGLPPLAETGLTHAEGYWEL